MNLLFIADPLDGFKIHKDTTYAMMREAAARGHQLHHTLSEQIALDRNTVTAHAVPVLLHGGEHPDGWYRTGSGQTLPLNSFDAVIMRTDPPFNLQYLYATQLLTLAENQGAKVFNSGQSMRDFNEKLAILNFPALTAPTFVGTRADDIRRFLAEHGDIIVKPLDGMGGSGIFRIRQGDPNTGSILETLTDNGRRTIMAQRYLPEIAQGDKRILVIGGQTVPYALARIPQDGDNRGNLAAGGRAEVRELSDRDREIAETLAPELVRRGILLAGLDVIGGCLTEINVTSPTGFQEIMRQKNFDTAALFTDKLTEWAADRPDTAAQAT